MSAGETTWAESSPAFADVGRGIRICYETFGDRADPTVLLTTGLGGQLLDWHPDLCRELVGAGFHVVRFDNRDGGLSTFLDEPVDVMEVLRVIAAGEQPRVPYLLADMAQDAVGLLDHLEVEQAHVVGISLGGMIAQEIAIGHQDRVATLVAMMTRTGDADSGLPGPAALQTFLEPPPDTRDEAIARGLANARIWGSEGVRDEDVRALQGAKWDRHHDPHGAPRQLAAILASGSRTERLRSSAVPTLVVHGTRDQLIQPDGGERLAEVVPDAKLLMIEGMGHDLARSFWSRWVEPLIAHARQHPPRPRTVG